MARQSPLDRLERECGLDDLLAVERAHGRDRPLAEGERLAEPAGGDNRLRGTSAAETYADHIDDRVLVRRK